MAWRCWSWGWRGLVDVDRPFVLEWLGIFGYASEIQWAVAFYSHCSCGSNGVIAYDCWYPSNMYISTVLCCNLAAPYCMRVTACHSMDCAYNCWMQMPIKVRQVGPPPTVCPSNLPMEHLLAFAMAHFFSSSAMSYGKWWNISMKRCGFPVSFQEDRFPLNMKTIPRIHSLFRFPKASQHSGLWVPNDFDWLWTNLQRVPEWCSLATREIGWYRCSLAEYWLVILQPRDGKVQKYVQLAATHNHTVRFFDRGKTERVEINTILPRPFLDQLGRGGPL